MNDTLVPTSPRERALIATTLTTAGHGDLAIRLGSELEGDATSRQLEAIRREMQNQGESLRKDLRMVFFGNIIVVIVAMGLIAAMVGVSLSLSAGDRSLDITPSSIELTTPEIEFEPMPAPAGPESDGSASIDAQTTGLVDP